MRTPRANRLSLGVLALTIGLGASPILANAEKELHWTFAEGQKLRYEVAQKTSGTIKRGQESIQTTNDWSATLRWTVKSVDPSGTATIVMRVERVRLQVRTGALKIEYDSQKPSNKDEALVRPFHELYANALGEDFLLKLSATGKVLEAKVPEKLTRALASSPFAAIAESPGVLSENGVKNLLAQLIPVFPDEPVDRGASWKGVVELPAPPLRLSVAMTEELTALGDDRAEVRVACETSVHTEPGSLFKFTLKKQEGGGESSFDRKAGRIVNSTLKQTLELVLSYMDQDSPQSIVIDTRLTIVR